jgi:PelA/Pel-15E family pectate lyase
MSTFPYFTSTFLAAGVILSPFSALAAGGAAAYLKKDDAWFDSAEGRRVTANILSHQSDLGGWPKNTDTVGSPYTGDREEIRPTFDNGATTDELRFLAESFHSTRKETERAAFAKGLAYILKAQYTTGGWPQFYPPGKEYHRHITFNDGAMVRVLGFLRDVRSGETYSFLPASDREAAGRAFEKGISCILKCQIKIGDKPTVWCAQHDEIDHRPRAARTFELASLSGSESVGIVRLLMSIDDPSPEVIAAVEGAVSWLISAKLTGIRLEKRSDPNTEKDADHVIVDDPSAPPLWARFYDLETQKPFFCDRDGVPKPSLADIGEERRNGYSWYGNWPEKLLEREYPKWREQHHL